jgi:hypothetical protein
MQFYSFFLFLQEAGIYKNEKTKGNVNNYRERDDEINNRQRKLTSFQYMQFDTSCSIHLV